MNLFLTLNFLIYGNFIRCGHQNLVSLACLYKYSTKEIRLHVLETCH